MGVGVASLVKPVPTPALSVVWAGKESAYKASPCVGTFVVDEGVSFFGRWEKACEIERDPAYEGGTVGGG